MGNIADFLSPIEDLIEDARNGRMFILADDEDRENEGDLVLPAQMVTPETINFMAKYGRGLICLALTGDRVRELGLPPMTQYNKSRHETAFTVSIEAATGITTGISASDRARTISVAVDLAKDKHDICSPGHVFPLQARDGGVLVRAGHTEAAVDISRLAGLIPAGVICEIMNDDGTMARLPELIIFARQHNLKISTIKDLINYRRRHDKLVERRAEHDFVSYYGGAFKLFVYVNIIDQSETMVLVKGDIHKQDPVLVRMHPMLPNYDVLGEVSPRTGQLERAMRYINKAGSGVVVLLREWQSLETHYAAGEGFGPTIRDYGIGAQILLDLDVKNMVLLSNSRPIMKGIEGYGLNIVGYQPIPAADDEEDVASSNAHGRA